MKNKVSELSILIMIIVLTIGIVFPEKNDSENSYVEYKKIENLLEPKTSLIDPNYLRNISVYQPSGVAVNKSGYIYVSDPNYHVIHVFYPDGSTAFNFGEYGTGDGQFKSPTDMDFDSNGDLYVLDELNCRIQVYTSQGQFLRQWTSAPMGSTTKGLAISLDDKVHLAWFDVGGKVRVFDIYGNFIKDYGSSSLSRPLYIAFNSSNYAFISDYALHGVAIFNATGDFVKSFACGDLVKKICINESNHVFVGVTNINSATIKIYNYSGGYINEFGTYGTGDLNLNSPTGIDFYNGHAYIADTGNNAVKIYFNSPPTIDNLNLSYSTNLDLSFEFNDTNNDTCNQTEIKWYQNNVYQSQFDNALSIPKVNLIIGDLWNASVRVCDSFNWSLLYMKNLTILNQIPKISTPDNQSFEYNTGSHILSWIITDNDYFQPNYTIYNNSVKVLTQNCNPQNPVIYDCSSFIIGVYNITILYQDGYGGQVSDEVWINITNGLPQITSISDYDLFMGTPGSHIDWIITDHSSSSPFYNISKDGIVVYTGNIWNSGQAIEYGIENLTIGLYTFNITFWDGFGLNCSDEVKINVINANPSVTNPPDLAGVIVGQTDVLIEWTPTDYSNLSTSFTIHVNNDTVIGPLSWTSGTPISYNVNTTAAGVYNITICLLDGYGGMTNDSVIVTISPYIPPTITNPLVTHPDDLPNVKVGQKNVLIIWIPTDTSTNNPTYTISINNVKVVGPVKWSSNSAITYTMNTDNPGTYNVTLCLMDGLGGITYDLVIVIISNEPTTTPDTNSDPDETGNWVIGSVSIPIWSLYLASGGVLGTAILVIVRKKHRESILFR